MSGYPDHFILPAMPRADGTSYTSRCVCGWRSEPRDTWWAADALGDDHIREIEQPGGRMRHMPGQPPGGARR